MNQFCINAVCAFFFWLAAVIMIVDAASRAVVVAVKTAVAAVATFGDCHS